MKFKSSGRRLALPESKQFRAVLVGENFYLNTARVELRDAEDPEMALETLRKLPFVEYAEVDHPMRTLQIQSDPYLPSQYAIGRMRLTEAWQITKGTNDIVVAVVDTGVDLQHPDLIDRLTPGYDFVNNDLTPHDDHGHGTHCAGIVAATAGNGIGISGVAPLCRIMPVKVIGDDGTGYTSDVADGIVYAVNNGAKIVSLSLGGPSSSSTLRNAINYAWQHGAIVVAAAGNSNTSKPSYPAYYDNAIAVASSDWNDARSSFSNYGDWVDVAAPGSAIISTTLGGNYGGMSGTSMACPQVAGVAALVWSALGENVTNEEVRNRIEATADDVGPWVVHGRVNAIKAISATDLPGHQLTFAQNPVTGGKSTSATLTLSAPVTENGTLFSLTSSSPDLVSVPYTLRFSKGQRAASFIVRTRSCNTNSEVLISAKRSSNVTSSSLGISPIKLDRLELSQISVKGPMLRIHLTAGAPLGGTIVNLSSSDPSLLSVPASVQIGRYQSYTNVILTPAQVSETKYVSVSASCGGVTKSVTVAVQPPTVQSVKMGRAKSGHAVSISVTLMAPAGAEGVEILLTSSNPAAMPLPERLVVPATKRGASCNVRLPKVSSRTLVTVTATAGGNKVTGYTSISP